MHCKTSFGVLESADLGSASGLWLGYGYKCLKKCDPNVDSISSLKVQRITMTLVFIEIEGC